jgi:hypothetical protein
LIHWEGDSSFTPIGKISVGDVEGSVAHSPIPDDERTREGSVPPGLTDYGDYYPDHLVRLYNKARLHAIDAFFMQVRRRLSLLERPISTAISGNRKWNGYSVHNPESIVNMLSIFRVFYNYCLASKDGKTPAMRVGLAKGKIPLEDVIYF